MNPPLFPAGSELAAAMSRGCSLRGSASPSEPQAPHSLALLLMRGFKSSENQRLKKKKKGFWVSFLKSLNMRTKNRQPRMPCANPNPRPSQEKQLGFSTRALGTCRKRDQEHGSLSEVHWPGSLCSASPRAGTTPVCKAPALFPLPQVPSGQTSPAEQGSWTTGPGRRWARAPSAGPGLVTGSRYRIA